MTGKVNKTYVINCSTEELETLYEAIIVAMKHTPECNPIMDEYDKLKEAIYKLL